MRQADYALRHVTDVQRHLDGNVLSPATREWMRKDFPRADARRVIYPAQYTRAFRLARHVRPCAGIHVLSGGQQEDVDGRA